MDRDALLFRRMFLGTLAAGCLYASLTRGADLLPPEPDAAWQVQVRPFPVRAPRNDSAAVPLTAEIKQLATELDPLALVPADAEPAVPAPVAADSVATVPAVSRETHFADENWTVTITPRPGVTVNGRRYADVYNSVPFSQAEYLANPGYRHEATMEILFNQLRPKTVVSHYEPQTIPSPPFTLYQPYRYSQTELYYAWRPQLPYSWGFPVSPMYPSYPTYPMLY